MRLFPALQGLLSKAFAFIGHRLPRGGRRLSSQGDHILSDAVRLAELPSPVEREAPRAAFVVERLKGIAAEVEVDEEGNVLVHFKAPGAVDSRPLLVYADLGTRRWHPLRSLCRVDSIVARGAGLSDALSAAVLLALAESFHDAPMERNRDLLLLFSARAIEDPHRGIFERIATRPETRPVAAIGLRGSGLARISSRPLGTVRLSVSISLPPAKKGDKGGLGAPQAPSAVSLAATLVNHIEGVRWDAQGLTSCWVAKVEAGAGFGHRPAEAVVEIELDSPDAGVLELASSALRATAERSGIDSGAKVNVREDSRVPVSDPSLSSRLASLVAAVHKELRIKTVDESFADPAAFLTVLGVPAVSVGVADAEEGLDWDEVDTRSLDQGFRQLDLIVRRGFALYADGGEV